MNRFVLGGSDVHMSESENSDDAGVDDHWEASQAIDQSMQGVDFWGDSRFNRGPHDVDRYDCLDDNDVNAYEEEEASQAEDGSTQNVDKSAQSTAECNEWTVYIRKVWYDIGEANATTHNALEKNTVLL